MEDRSERDRQLVRRVLEGDGRAFDDLVARYQSLVSGVAWRYGVPRDEIEDVVSEVFIKVYQNLHRYRPDHPFTTWLYRLSANRAIDHQRRRRRERERGEMPEQIADPRPGAGASLEERERVDLVREALAEIPGRFRKAIMLVYVEGMKIEEAAAVLGRPTGTVKTRLMRGRAALRKALLRRRPEMFGNGERNAV
jgi:RNA polymerase sigma-70 factor (ECF subfamily)